MENIVITGLGVVSPAGIGKAQFWRNIREGHCFISKITRFEASLYPSHIAGQIKDLDAYSNVSPRLLKKIDLFSHLALIASELAMKDAKLELSKENLGRVGIFMGNALGGWLYAETELRDLYLEGREGVSPFLASAWFPAAPQGQISIYWGIKGFSKTIVADRASSLMAIDYAQKILEDNKLDFALCGGMEAPVTPYALLCCSTYGALSTKNQTPDCAYQPFDKNRDGLVIGEGAGVIILESEERARQRNVHIYAKIAGFATTSDGYDRIKSEPEGRELARAIKMCLEDSGFSPETIDYICADGIATREGDISETKAIKMAFGKYADKIPISCPKSMFGNLLGASGALDLISTTLALQHNLIPPTINYKVPDPDCDLDYVPNKSQHKEIKRALVISRGRGGINTVLAIEKIATTENADKKSADSSG